MTDRSGIFWDAMEGRLPLPPISAMLGFKLLSFEPEQGTMEAEFLAVNDFVNARGSVQGGIITAMLDDAMAYAGTAYLEGLHMLPTLEIKTSFIRPASAGRLFGTGKVVRRGRDFIFLEGLLKDQDAQLIATASATARIVAMIKPATAK